ncbi:hypothetical protein N9D23_03495 [Rubripirellula sp.]|jgi:hypothetical protein|nr:hypothetical protein [Planctomycetaceae bacterium]MDA9857157.1 hypothetical protein [Rubripirellula sp.]MDF1841489.1 hypothetical protein [Rubripirellula sp.]
MLNKADLETLNRLADVLIPANENMPSASQADLETWHQHVLKVRPELAEPLQKIIASATTQEPNRHVKYLREHNRRNFRVLTTVVCSAYFMNPSVQERIGYNGQQPLQTELLHEDFETDLLEVVVRRGPIFRVAADDATE